eukprot:scaffold25892_cov32-Tisochrysis_lutea.AAC.2
MDTGIEPLRLGGSEYSFLHCYLGHMCELTLFPSSLSGGRFPPFALPSIEASDHLGLPSPLAGVAISFPVLVEA